MVGELHADPAMGHKKKGSTGNQRSRKFGNQHMSAESHSYDFSKPSRKKRA